MVEVYNIVHLAKFKLPNCYMKCPYCAEKIKDEAIVCRYCRRDLVSILPITKRLDSIENNISELDEKVQGLIKLVTAQNIISTKTVPSNNSLLFIILALFIGGVFSCGFYSLYTWLPSMRPSALWISLLTPLFIGIIIGIALAIKRLGNYILIGVGAGFINSFGVIINLVFYTREYGGNVDIVKVIVLYFMTPFLLTLSGCLIGDWISARRAGSGEQPNYARDLAQRLTKSKLESSEDTDDQVESLTKLIAALAPIIASLASIISAIFTFLAA